MLIPEQIHDPEGSDQRDRHRNAGDEGGARAAQENENHQNDQDDRDDQRAFRHHVPRRGW